MLVVIDEIDFTCESQSVLTRYAIPGVGDEGHAGPCGRTAPEEVPFASQLALTAPALHCLHPLSGFPGLCGADSLTSGSGQPSVLRKGNQDTRSGKETP